MRDTPIHVVHFQRRPPKGRYSVERLFATVREHLPPPSRCTAAVSRFEARGVLRRVYNVVEAALRQGDVNHVTGDVNYLACLMKRRRTVSTFLDCILLHKHRGLRREICRVLFYALPVRRSACVTVISESVKQELLAQVRCDPDRIRVVHVPVSDALRPDSRPFNADRPVVLQIGTKENKNLERTAAALRGVPCRLRVIGRLTPAQEQALNDSGVEWSSAAGLDDDAIAAEYRACDLVVFASTYEGFGMPIIEANAVGRPVVTSNVAPMPEVAGAAACLVDPFDAASIRAGILRVIEEAAYREALVAEGFRNVERFRPEAIARQYADIYEELARSS